jgi:outer membrane protein
MTAKIAACLLSSLFLCWTLQAQENGAAMPVPNAAGQNAVPLTLDQAETIAIKNNPQITVGKLRALVAQEQVREVRSALLPDVSVNLTGVESQPGGRISAGGLNNPVIYPRAGGGLVFSQLITDFGRTTNLVSSSKFQAQSEAENAAATRAQILLAVDHAFYGALETQALVRVAEETVKDRQVLADKISALTQAKLKSDLDASFAEVDLSRAKLLLLEAKNNRETSLAELSAILGYSDLQDLRPSEEPDEVKPPLPDVVPLIQEALQQRPEVRALQFEEQSAEKFSHAEHDLWRPTVSALGVVGETPVRDDHIPNWYGAAGVNITIPIFNGLLNNARAKSADLETEASRQKLLDLRNNVARDVRISWQDSNRAYERLSVTAQLRRQAGLALELAQSRYNLGLSSIVEYSQAELQKTEADIADTDAVYHFRQSERVLEYVVGVLK